MPSSPHAAQSAAADGRPPFDDDHESMKKQWQNNLEIDLLKSAWIRKDREQQAHMLSAAK